MQLMADSVRDFTVADRQKNPSEELIVSWITIALSDISIILFNIHQLTITLLVGF